MSLPPGHAGKASGGTNGNAQRAQRRTIYWIIWDMILECAHFWFFFLPRCAVLHMAKYRIVGYSVHLHVRFSSKWHASALRAPCHHPATCPARRTSATALLDTTGGARTSRPAAAFSRVAHTTPKHPWSHPGRSSPQRRDRATPCSEQLHATPCAPLPRHE